MLLREEYPEDALSRAYYATLHVAKAALLMHDVVAESHAAVKRLFGLHLIRSGAIEAVWASHLSESLDDRSALCERPRFAIPYRLCEPCDVVGVAHGQRAATPPG